MKKFLTTLLFLCSCAFIGAAVGCENNPNSEVPPTASSEEESTLSPTARSVRFEGGEGYSFKGNVENGGTIEEGYQLNFTLELGAFYAGSPIVFVNDVVVAPNASGVYSYNVGTENVVIRAEGVLKDTPTLSGVGTMDSPFVIAKPIDLLYMAQQVNAGNQDYCRGNYVLVNDIDCKGEELEVIGNYSTQNSVFSGSFTSDKDANTNEVEFFTISNFHIRSENSNYVGLFGAVFADPSVENSGLFYGIRLENFSVNAGVKDILTDDNKTISCGGLIGYGVGANLLLCESRNGTVNVNSDNNYFSFVGGLIGYQQGFYDSGYGISYASEISYATVDVDVNVLGGVALYAGGIVGFMTTNTPYGATASVHNSYSLGDVSGALRSGGIVGGLGQYSVVSNCYAASTVTARSYQRFDSPLITSDQYCHAYAGGLVGYAENDTVTHDSFFNGTLSTYTPSLISYEHVDAAVAGGDPAGTATVNAEKYLVLDCLQDVNLSNVGTLTALLGWQNYDWVFTAGKLPTINYESSTTSTKLNLTVKYVSTTGEKILVEGTQDWSVAFFDTSTQTMASYSPVGSFVLGDSNIPLLASVYQAENDFRSYGYFFDEACTLRVPASYMPAKNITLYVGFADPQPVVGTYYLMTEGSTKLLSVELTADGKAFYSDGNSTMETTFLFNGTSVLLEYARLARYFNGEIEVDEEDETLVNDPNFDVFRYDFYNFAGEITADGINFYDGTFFTKDAPLVSQKDAIRGEYYKKNGSETVFYTFYGNLVSAESSKEDGVYEEYTLVAINGNVVTLKDSAGAESTLDISTLSSFDGFKGTWVKSATANKSYTFDGMGSFTYAYTTYDRASGTFDPVSETFTGSYEYVNGDSSKIRFECDGVTYTASFNADGFLEITDGSVTQSYYANHSSVGDWNGGAYELSLYGIREDGLGKANITLEGYTTELLYEVSETDGVIVFYYPVANGSWEKDYVFGYAKYNERYSWLDFVLPNNETSSGYAAQRFYLYDDYYGDWVCDASNFTELTFDGNGLYGYMGQRGEVLLTLTDGTVVSTKYDLDSALSGSFAYDGKTYEISYDEITKQVSVLLRVDGENDTLVRKDALAAIDFVDLDGIVYTFDGRSTLSGTGTLTVGEGQNAKTYAYEQAADGNGFTVLDGMGGFVRHDAKNGYYLLKADGVETKLYITNQFMGDWAISGEFSLFHIGPTDTNGVIKAEFKGHQVDMTFLDSATLTFHYKEGKMPYTYYVFVRYDETTKENILVLSEYTNFASGDYTVCTKASEVYGDWTWVNEDGIKHTLSFDGVQSGYANGLAKITMHLTHTNPTTTYYYAHKNGRIIMWSTEAVEEGRMTLYHAVTIVNVADAAGKPVFVKQDGVGALGILYYEADSLFSTLASDKFNVKYFFDNIEGKSVVTVQGVIKYNYKVTAHEDGYAVVALTEVATGLTYKATLTYDGFLLEIKEPIFFVADTAHDGNGVEYVFSNTSNTVTVNRETVYTYEVVEINVNGEAVLLLTEYVDSTEENPENPKTYEATLRYSDLLLTIGSEVQD